MSIQDKLKKCLKEGEKGERHKGLRKIEVSEEKIKGHLNKAIHNFKAMTSFQKTGFSDWSASAAFYCLYHCLLALIAKEGYESRNQICTRNEAVEEFNEEIIKLVNKKDKATTTTNKANKYFSSTFFHLLFSFFLYQLYNFRINVFVKNFFR